MRSDLYQEMYHQEEYYWWHKAKRELVKKLLPRQNNLRILDIGCGTGKLMEDLRQSGEVWGIDVNPQAVNFCHRRGLKRVSLEKFPDITLHQKFDVIICLDVLEHIKDDHKAIAVISHLLKNNGLAIITVPAYQWLFSYWDEILHHYRRYYPRQLRRCFLGTGLKIFKLSFVYSFLLPLAIPFRFLRHRSFMKKTPTSDFIKLPQWIHAFFFALAKIEQLLIQYVNLPFGISLLCVAKKN